MQASRKRKKPHIMPHPWMRLVQNKSIQHRPFNFPVNSQMNSPSSRRIQYDGVAQTGVLSYLKHLVTIIFFCDRRPLPFGGSHLRLPSGLAGIRTTTGSLSALARPTPYQLSHRVLARERRSLWDDTSRTTAAASRKPLSAVVVREAPG